MATKLEAIEREFNEASAIQDEHGRMERLYRWARTHGKWLVERAHEAQTFDKRLDVLSNCEDCVMGGHCIEVIGGEYDKELDEELARVTADKQLALNVSGERPHQ